jgi:hypothetical protein
VEKQWKADEIEHGVDHAGVDLQRISGAYDASLGAEQVGYLRPHHGYFSVECPDCGGQLVLGAHPHGDGSFTEAERDGCLAQARAALQLCRTADTERTIGPVRHDPGKDDVNGMVFDR